MGSKAVALLLITVSLQGCTLLRPDLAERNDAIKAAAACQKKQNTSHVEYSKCLDEAVGIVRRVPYPDLINLFAATRLEIATRADRWEISPEQERLETAKAYSEAVSEVHRRRFATPSEERNSILGKDTSLWAIAVGIFAFLFKYWLDSLKESVNRRIEIYERLRRRFDQEEAFLPIFIALDDREDATTPAAIRAAEIKLKSIDVRLRARFAAFIEDVALYTKSGVFNYDLANYEFGDYTRMCYKFDAFWDGLCDSGKDKRTEPLWAMFRDFKGNIAFSHRMLKANSKRKVKMIRISWEWWRPWTDGGRIRRILFGRRKRIEPAYLRRWA